MSGKFQRCLCEVEDFLKRHSDYFYTASSIMNQLIVEKQLHFSRGLVRSVCDHLVYIDTLEQVSASNQRRLIDAYRFRYNPGAQQRKRDEKDAKNEFYKKRYYEAKGWEYKKK